jgi:hypothetical protein
VRSLADGVLVCEPLVMGAPWLTAVGEELFPGPEWFSYSYGEVFAEDIDELAASASIESVDEWQVIKRISERAFKQCLAELLGEDAPRDWGGEQSDLYSAHVHLGGQRTTAAFLLKGPARFVPMTLNQLGKNNDQIYRLAQEPARLLVVQHSHDITQAVRATLRAFTVAPGALRRYCLIDGRDSYRILKAYDKLDRALELSE